MTTPTAVDLFAGPGGLDEAARQLGIRTVGIEYDPDACTTRRAAGLATIEADVRKHGPRDFPTATDLLGGPPCQTFTIAGNGSGRAELDRVINAVKLMGARNDIDPGMFADPRTALILEPLRWAISDFECGYNTIVLEQVPQALPVWEAYAEVLADEGYSVATGVLRTEQYGAPQTRKRAVLIARLVGEARLPEPTHRPYRKGVPQCEGDPALKPWVSMADVLSGRGPFTVISNYGTGGDPKNRGRRTSDEPAFTVTGKISRLRLVAHDGSELPRLTASEAGQLQGFPADYPWAGGDIAQQIGNAVPVQLGRALITAATGITAAQPLQAAA